MSILDYSKPSYQHSISVPKQVFFAICIKWALSQQQSHHLPVVQSICSLGAALPFSLSPWSCWVPVGHSPDVFFPDKQAFVLDSHVSGSGSFTVTICHFSVYVQFYFEDVQVLHAAEGQIQKVLRSGNSSSLRKKKDGSTTSELETPEAKMLKLEDPKADSGRDENCQGDQSSTRKMSCVSHLFLVTQKEGLMLRNYQLPAEEAKEAKEPQHSFQATVLWLGRPQLWSHPRKTGDLPELEETGCDGKDVMQQEVRQLWGVVW